jgi:hypothetical protein
MELQAIIAKRTGWEEFKQTYVCHWLLLPFLIHVVVGVSTDKSPHRQSRSNYKMAKSNTKLNQFEVIEYDTGKYSLGLVPQGSFTFCVVNEDGEKIFEGEKEDCIRLLHDLNGKD